MPKATYFKCKKMPDLDLPLAWIFLPCLYCEFEVVGSKVCLACDWVVGRGGEWKLHARAHGNCRLSLKVHRTSLWGLGSLPMEFLSVGFNYKAHGGGSSIPLNINLWNPNETWLENWVRGSRGLWGTGCSSLTPEWCRVVVGASDPPSRWQAQQLLLQL